ncbi:MAG: hypothetical protein ABI823_13830 [Bryobacteraceae bacterium]
MSVTSNASPQSVRPVLAGPEGELLLVRIEVPAARLETVLDCLATVPFPLNPELHHGHPRSAVEFPAYGPWLPQLRATLDAVGLGETTLSISPMLDVLR